MFHEQRACGRQQGAARREFARRLQPLGRGGQVARFLVVPPAQFGRLARLHLRADRFDERAQIIGLALHGFEIAGGVDIRDHEVRAVTERPREIMEVLLAAEREPAPLCGLLFDPREHAELVFAHFAHHHTHAARAFDAPLRALGVRPEQRALIADAAEVLDVDPTVHHGVVAGTEALVPPVRVCVVAHERTVRRAIRAAVGMVPAVDIVGPARDAQRVVAAAVREDRLAHRAHHVGVVRVAQRPRPHRPDRPEARGRVCDHRASDRLITLVDHADERRARAVRLRHVAHAQRLLEAAFGHALRELLKFAVAQRAHVPVACGCLCHRPAFRERSTLRIP